MDFKKDNFPIIQYMEEYAVSEVNTELFLEYLDDADKNINDGRYKFSLILEQIANDPDCKSYLPGLPEDLRQKTLTQAIRIFKELANTGHEDAKYMYDYIVSDNPKQGGISKPALKM